MLVVKLAPGQGVNIFDGDNRLVARVVMQERYRIGVEAPHDFLLMRDQLLERRTPEQFRRDRDRLAS